MNPTVALQLRALHLGDAPPDDGDAAPRRDHLVLVEDKWPILDWERGGLGQKKPYFD